MNLVYNKGKISKINLKGDVKSGFSSQDFYMSKEIKQIGTRYIEGLAGVKLRTPSGLTITTDEFGRYNIPDEHVEQERGRNFIIKLDEASLPKGFEVITENPKSKLITQYGLNEINFGVKVKKQYFEFYQ